MVTRYKDRLNFSVAQLCRERQQLAGHGPRQHTRLEGPTSGERGAEKVITAASEAAMTVLWSLDSSFI